MKVLCACLKYDYGIEKRGVSLEKQSILPSFEKCGVEVVYFWLEEHGFPSNLNQLQIQLIIAAEKCSPDLIFFMLMKNEIRLETIDKLNLKYKTVNWFSDDQWRFNIYSKFVAKHFSYVLTVDKFSIPKYHKYGVNNVNLVQWAPVSVDADYCEAPDYLYDVSFVGSKNPTREWIIKKLRKDGINVVCFGSGWKNGRVSFNEMRDIFQHSKINLNLSNSVPKDISYYGYVFKLIIVSMFCLNRNKIKASLKSVKQLFSGAKRVEQLKARMFEIPGFCGFMLSQYSLALDDYYNIGSEVAIFSNIDELEIQIKYYLCESETREKLRRASYFRTKKYSYYKYINNFLKDNFLWEK